MSSQSSWLDRARGLGSGILAGREFVRGVRVFCYHGIVERKTDQRLERNFHTLQDFRNHVDFLCRQRALGLAELECELRAPGFPSRPAAVITFDDGFENNLLAAEVLERAHLPWSLFVTTGAIGGAGAFWPSELSLLLLHGQAAQVTAFGAVWSLRTRPEREQAYAEIRRTLKTCDSEGRTRVIDELRMQFPAGETARLMERFPSFRMLTWNQVHELSASGVEIGSHGVSHELHHAAQPDAVRMRELLDSKNELERRTGKECRAFAFPNGTCQPASSEDLRRAGFDMGFTTVRQAVNEDSDWRLIPRFDPPSSMVSFTRNFYWRT